MLPARLIFIDNAWPSLPQTGARVQDPPAAASSRTWTQSLYARTPDLDAPLDLGAGPLVRVRSGHRLPLNHRRIGFQFTLARLPGARLLTGSLCIPSVMELAHAATEFATSCYLVVPAFLPLLTA